MNFKTQNTIYFWSGDRTQGEWKQAALPAGADFKFLKAQIEAGGRVAHFGHTNVGPPEGPPSEKEFLAIGA